MELRAVSVHENPFQTLKNTFDLRAVEHKSLLVGWEIESDGKKNVCAAERELRGDGWGVGASNER